jgi:hypothetical protein
MSADQQPATGISLALEPSALTPLIRAVVQETLASMESIRQRVDDRLCYAEPEAAALLGLQPHQLRDERRRGRIKASQIVGRRVRYLKQDLLDYLLSRRA